MSKRLVLVLALAFVFGVTFCAYAEVQNVKVSGDLTVMGISRNDLDLTKTTGGGATSNDEQNNFSSIARVRIDADLTDNVMATIRLINERDWDGEDTTTTEANNIEIDLAYATMKEFLYSPLSLTIGRQELRYGNALVVGDPDTNNLAAASTLTAGDLSLRKSFDAIKAVLNYDPLTVDLVYAKIDENTIRGANSNDDIDLYGINANYALNKDTTLEGYIFSKQTGSNATKFTAAQRTTGVALADPGTKENDIHTVGVRVANTSVKNLMAQLEAAFQFGKYNPGYDINSQNAAVEGDRRAYALQAIAHYNLMDIVPSSLSKYKPQVMGTYTYLSGEKNTRTSGTYHGWDPMFEDQTPGSLINAIFGYSNSHTLALTGKVNPMEDVGFRVDYAAVWLDKKFPDTGTATAGFNTVNMRGVAGASTYTMTGKRFLGQELDATLTYDYTEDVQFGLRSGIFFPGDALQGNNDRNATELIGTMKVTF
ncbi:MAG: hypothetical protein C4533_02825 [Candidatus Omnitrophota bacterium]|jgi:hypothetical protein|nr:MAG: hypothetical protein C4533_02825 [Candidatus Omnitrophota bacterium]